MGHAAACSLLWMRHSLDSVGVNDFIEGFGFWEVQAFKFGILWHSVVWRQLMGQRCWTASWMSLGVLEALDTTFLQRQLHFKSKNPVLI